jgi:selenocysteine-specific translation elongation factor
MFSQQSSRPVRSIQKRDEEFDLAWEGDRVGLALKNIEVEAWTAEPS